MLISNSFYGKCRTHPKQLCGKDLFSCVKPIRILFWREFFLFFRHLILFDLFLIFLEFFCPIQFNTWKRILLENVFENLIIFFKQNLLVKSLWGKHIWGQINYPVCCFS